MPEVFGVADVGGTTHEVKHTGHATVLPVSASCAWRRKVSSARHPTAQESGECTRVAFRTGEGECAFRLRCVEQ
jgi:hypothetical protein